MRKISAGHPTRGSSTAESEVSKSVAHGSPAAPPSLNWAQHTQPPMMRRIVVTIVKPFDSEDDSIDYNDDPYSDGNCDGNMARRIFRE